MFSVRSCGNSDVRLCFPEELDGCVDVPCALPVRVLVPDGCVRRCMVKNKCRAAHFFVGLFVCLFVYLFEKQIPPSRELQSQKEWPQHKEV